MKPKGGEEEVGEKERRRTRKAERRDIEEESTRTKSLGHSTL